MSITQADFDKGRRAKERFDKMIVTRYRPLLRAVTKNEDLNVVGHPSGAFTDNKTVWLPIPLALGDETLEHDKSFCGKRDPATLEMLCPWCQLEDRTDGVVFHESAHITEQSFEKVSGADVLKSVRALFGKHLDSLDPERVKRMERALRQATDSMEAANIIDAWLPFTLNLVEDVYVNRRLFKHRAGTELPLKLFSRDIFTQGILDASNGSTSFWSEKEDSAQALISVYLLGQGIPELADNLVQEHNLVDDKRAIELMEEIPSDCKPIVRIEIALKLLDYVRTLGYCQPKSDSILPPPPPPPPAKADPEPQAPGTPGDEVQEQPDPGEGDSGDEGDDAEQGDDADDTEDGEGGDDAQDGESDDDDGEGDGSDAEADDDADEADGDGEGDGSDAEADDDDEGDVAPTQAGSGSSTGAEGDDEGGDEGDEQSSSSSSGDDGDDEGESSSADADADAEGDDTQDDDPGSMTDDEIEEQLQRAKELMIYVMGHEDTGPTSSNSGSDALVLERVIKQEGFDHPTDFIEKFDLKTIKDYEGKAKPVEQKAPRSTLTPSIAKLRVVFAANRKTGMERSLPAGSRLDTRHLHRAGGGEDHRVFAKRNIPKSRNWFVCVGLDFSGSTASNGADIATMKAGHAVGEMLHELDVRFAMYAHTTGNLGGNRALEHVEIKSPSGNWRARGVQDVLFAQRGRGVNLDGHSLEQYRKIIEAERATDKMMMYFTDGEMPNANFYEELRLLQENITILQRQRCHLFGVGYRTDSPKAHGLDTIQFDDPDDVTSIVKGLEARLLR